MIPLRDNIPSKTLPVVNYLLIAANAFIFFLELKAGSGIIFLIEKYAFYPKELTLFFQGEVITAEPFKKMVTSMFLHGGFAHFFGNMLFLYIFGDNVEDRMGHLKYLFFYVFCGVVAVMLHYSFNIYSRVPTLGASGAIAGVMGAYFIFFPYARVLTLVPIFIFIQFIEIPAFFFLVFWFIMQFYMGSVSKILGTSNVAWWAHVGGFAAGALIAVLWRIVMKLRRMVF